MITCKKKVLHAISIYVSAECELRGERKSHNWFYFKKVEKPQTVLRILRVKLHFLLCKIQIFFYRNALKRSNNIKRLSRIKKKKKNCTSLFRKKKDCMHSKNEKNLKSLSYCATARIIIIAYRNVIESAFH